MSNKIFKLIAGALLVFSIFAIMPAEAYGQSKKADPPKSSNTKSTIKTVDLEVTGMTCQKGCADGIDRRFKKTNGVIKSKTTQATGISRVTYDESKVSLKELIDQINSRGFSAEVAKKKK